MDVLRHVKARLPDYQPGDDAEPLSGGYLNCVWRVRGRPHPVIVKVAPPAIAAMPDVPLDPGRIVIEARSLRELAPGGRLATIASAAVRPPRLLDFDAQRHVLIMEDVGDYPDLGRWLQHEAQGEAAAGQVGRLVGQFIGTLHRCSYRDAHLAELFDNSPIQYTRLEVQYRAIRGLCERAGLADAEHLGETAVALGELLQKPGLCVIMGDLWPRSILVTPEGIRIIDWELAHFGRPCQDVGHLVAHLWMHRQRAATSEAAARVQAGLEAFLAAYRAALGTRFDAVFGEAGIRESAVHWGAEVLVRTAGAFKDGYLYEGLSLDTPEVRDAIALAAEHIRSPMAVATFAPHRD